MTSFGLLRTNVGLTTNIKVMVDTNYKLSLDSIDSEVNLSFDKFKKVSFTKDNYYDELIPYFYKDLPSDIAFSIKYENDVESMSDDFKNQYDELYNYGARNIVNNKNYTEEYEYFAPLYITKKGLPKNFIIFRVDGSGIGNIRKDNFKIEILKKLKTVKLFDLTKETMLGEWLGKNFTDNKYFPDSPLDIDFRNLEFCRWNGIDYQNGGYTYKSLFIDDILDEEKEIFELEKFVFDSYKNNKVVFPNILNLSFLFDDTPSTPEIKRKWSINRYYGFYLENLEFVTSISPYLPVGLQPDTQIQTGNILYSATSSNPFVQDWSDKKPFYVEYKGTYYKVEQFTENVTNQLIKINNPLSTSESRTKKDLGFRTSKNTINNDVIKKSVSNTRSSVQEFGDVIVTKYRIISDLDLSGLTASSLNQNFGQIDINNKLIIANNINFLIDNFDDQEGNIGVWLIEINGIYHNLVKEDNSIRLSTDYSFTFNQNDFSYKIAAQSTKVSTVVDFNNLPKKFPIYRVKFTDIKDFDTRIIDTEFSKYEYEEHDNITKTDETKMYLEDILNNASPVNLDDFVYKDEIVNIPVSSEYTANYETFKIDTDLSEIWRKNSVYCRWGFQKSLSANDMPYLLNNSLIFEDFNRTTNFIDPVPKRIERNLDYFYTINSATSSYLHHTLHLESVNNNGNIDTSFRFDLNKYLGQSVGTFSHDYFSYLFSKKSSFLNNKIQKNTTKYSYFNVGDESVPNHTLFRGLRFDLYEVNGISLNSNNQIDKINIKSSNKFDDYKFSILLSDNNYQPLFATNSNQIIGLTFSNNDLSWKVIKEWRMDRQYGPYDIIIYNDMLFTLNGAAQSKNSPVSKIGNNLVSSNPITQGFQFYGSPTIFLNPTIEQTYIYNSSEYYYKSSTTGIDFWNPTLSYNINDLVFFKSKYYMSKITNNRYNPLESVAWVVFSTSTSDSVQRTETAREPVSTNLSFKWKLIEIWNFKTRYYGGDYVIYNNKVYELSSSQAGRETGRGLAAPEIPIQISVIGLSPEETDQWIYKSSIIPDTTFKYGLNDIIEMNDSYYLCNSQPNYTLDNNIIVYINKKWKNVLVNINIADNTYVNISETNRDDLYDVIYKKLTALNFTNAINDITNKYGFSDYISYIVTEEDGLITKKYGYQFYDIKNNKIENIKDLPYLLRCEEADKLDIKVDSLFKRAVQLPNTLNPFRKLNNGEIADLTRLNHYNNIPIAANIIENKFEPKIFENYHGNRNIVTNDIYRYSGYYTPIFYDIQLFERSEFDLGNYKFDVNLTDFGLMKERKVRKINRKGSQLRLANINDEKSIYPMLDEFGYSVYDFFIFSSTWDIKYYLETSQLSKSNNYLERYTIDENVVNSLQDITIPTLIPTDIGQIQNNN
jgi:hypothetical protein